MMLNRLVESSRQDKTSSLRSYDYHYDGVAFKLSLVDGADGDGDGNSGGASLPSKSLWFNIVILRPDERYVELFVCKSCKKQRQVKHFHASRVSDCLFVYTLTNGPELNYKASLSHRRQATLPVR